VVLADLDPDRYSAETFEEAVDVTASLATSLSVGKSPVQLRLSNGDRLGGATYRDPGPVVDYLTEVQPSSEGSMTSQLILLRRDRGGTALVVVTGQIDLGALPMIAALRRRFDRVIVVSIVEQPTRIPVHPGLTIIQARTADEVAHRWNTGVAR
jgi:hypothetical protein